MSWRSFAALVLLLFAGLGWAQEGVSTINIKGPAGRGTFVCHAYSCMNDTDDYKRSRLRNLQLIVENDCNQRSSAYTQDRCNKARDEFAGAQDCYSNQCRNATCRSRNMSTNRCVSPAYFR